MIKNHHGSLCRMHGNIGIQVKNNVYTSKEKKWWFCSKQPSSTKHSPPSYVYYIEFSLIELSVIGILKPKFIIKIRIWCII